MPFWKNREVVGWTPLVFYLIVLLIWFRPALWVLLGVLALAALSLLAEEALCRFLDWWN